MKSIPCSRMVVINHLAHHCPYRAIVQRGDSFYRKRHDPKKKKKGGAAASNKQNS